MNKMQKMTSILLFTIGGLSAVLAASDIEVQAATNNIKVDVLLEGKKLTFDQEPIVIDGITYIPLRNVAETTGSTVDWNSETKLINIKDSNKDLTFAIGSDKGILNGKSIDMPKSFVIKETYRTMVPLRFVSETLNLDVEWVQKTGQILITKKKEEVLESSSNKEEIIIIPDSGSVASNEANLIKIANELQENAKKYIGTPYAYGASPNTISYFDCSSFTQRLFAESGINLPRVSSAQYEYGKSIPFEELKAGDLVFFDTAGNGKITHVSIFIDSNKLLHATVSKGVDYTTFSSYWKERYLSAARVVK